MKLPDLSILRLDFCLRAEEPVALPPFLGSTLRGALGRALKQVFCFVPHGDCARCWFQQACAYQYIFESKNLGNIPADELHNNLQKNRDLPHPFVLIAPNPLKKRRSHLSETPNYDKNFNEDYQPNHFSAGETLDFSLLLTGKAARHWAHVLVAVRLLAENGLGEQPSRVPFALIEAFAHDAYGRRLCVFDKKDPQVLTYGVSPVKLAQIVNLQIGIMEERMQTQDENYLQVDFLSPTSQRILLDGKVNGQISFKSLMKKITERLEYLACLHVEPSQRIDYRPILDGAEDVRVTDKSLRFYRYEQHSERQGRRISRDVFLGKIIYQGERLREYLPFLAAGELLNVGADTSAGLGKFVIQAYA